MATMNVLDSVGATVAVEKPLAPGRAAAAASRPVALSTEDAAFLDNVETLLTSIDGKLTTIDGRVDGLEGLIGTTNTTLTTIDGRVDGLEAVLGTATDAAVANGAAGSIAGYMRSTKDAATDTSTASPINMTQIGSNLVATNNGVASTGCPRVVIASDNTPFSVNANVQTPSDVIPLAPTLDTAAYAAGDVLFATVSLAGVARANDLRAVLMSLTVMDKTKQKPAFTLYFFKTNVTSGAFNVAPTLSDADAVNYMGHVSVLAADYKDLTNNSFASYKAINLLLEAAAGATNVYVFGVLDAGTPTFANGDLQLGFGVVQS